MTTFKDFILGQMKNAGLAKHTRDPIYKLGFTYFREAFTHKSFRSVNFKDIHELRSMQFSMEEIESINSLEEIDKFPTYEQLEFVGDKEINVCISKHIVVKFPRLPAGNLTFSFQKLASEKYLSLFAKKQGFFNHILLSPQLYHQAVLWRDGRQQELSNDFYQGTQIYDIHAKLVEDVCEAFAGALVKAVDEYSKSVFGPGVAILYTWTKGIMNELDFDPNNLDEIKPPGIVLRENWESIYAQRTNAIKKFTNKDMFIIDVYKRHPGYIPIKAVDPVTKQVIAETVGVTEKDANFKAASLANKIIKNKFADKIEQGRAFKRAQRQQNVEDEDEDN